MSDEERTCELTLSGSPGAPGIVIGKASLYRRGKPIVSGDRVDEAGVQQQVEKFQQALAKAETELRHLLDVRHDEQTVELMHTQIEILNDPELCKRVKLEITDKKKPADSAIQTVFGQYLKLMRENHELAFRERSVDIADVRDRLIQILHNHDDEFVEGTVLVARELSPREIIAISSHDIRGIIMDRGGTTSHAVIIARSMGIPAVVGTKRASELIDSDQEIVLDGIGGEVIVAPTESTLEKYRLRMQQQEADAADLEAVCRQENTTKDGTVFRLQANIEFAEELQVVKKYFAEGIGLLRTESIYLQQTRFEDTEQQVSFYKTIVEATEPHTVTIRLFDTGGDKFFEEREIEQNPFLGWRGIRMLLDEKELLKKQLRAILITAASYNNRIRILIPMISVLEQLAEIKKMISDLQGELQSEGIAIEKTPELGIMVEVPNVALQASLFARQADFLSIGTNDLAQYVLAVDRGNERIAKLYDQRHPAMWRLIKQVADAAQTEGKPVSVCGELASDPIAACCLMGLGIHELSMNPAVLPVVKRELRKHTLAEMQELADHVLACNTIEEIEQVFSKWISTQKINTTEA